MWIVGKNSSSLIRIAFKGYFRLEGTLCKGRYGERTYLVGGESWYWRVHDEKKGLLYARHCSRWEVHMKKRKILLQQSNSKQINM